MDAGSENWNNQVLLKRLQQGDAAAFSEIYYLYSPAIYRKILWMVNDEETAKELLQDLFMKLWENREKIDLSKSFRSYLYTIAVNLVYDCFRKASRKSDFEAQVLLQATDCYSHIEEKIFSREDTTLLNEVINQLPEQRRKIFILCKVEGRSYEEVSELLHISKSTIQDHIVKANHFIKDFLSRNPGIVLCLVFQLLPFWVMN